MRAPTELPAAVHDPDRRRGRPLHPCALTPRERVAVDHHPRLARLGDRDARGHRSAHRSDRPRRHRRGRLPRRDSLDPRLRLLGPALRARLVRGPRREGLAEVDGPPRLQALRRPGRRPGGGRHRRDGSRGAQGTPRRPHEPAGPGAREHGRLSHRHRRGARRRRSPEDLPRQRLRLLPRAGDTAADDRLRPAGFTRLARGLDARPRHRQLLQGHERLRRRQARGQPHPRPHPRQHHHLLAHRHRGLGRPVLLGGRTGERPCRRPTPPPVSIPVGYTTFPGEIFRAPRSWVEKAYPSLTYFNEVDRGGHFAAWEEPELFSAELREAFRPLR